jgi:hypothetical protein
MGKCYKWRDDSQHNYIQNNYKYNATLSMMALEHNAVVLSVLFLYCRK